MAVKFNPFTGNLDFVNEFAVSDPLTLDNLTVNQLLTAGHIHGNLAGSVYIHVKNLDDEPLEKGAPFYISGTVGSSDRVEVKRARADDPSRGPAIGLIDDTLAVNGEGNGVIIGEIFQYDTDTPNWETNQPLYVSATGTLTNVRPATGYRQIVGYAGRIQSSTGTIIVAGGKKEAVAGSDTQIQFNDDGGFGASADLTWDDTAKELGIGGDINLDDGGSFTTTVQCVTPTANRTISFPDKTGTIALVAGSSGQVTYNSSGANAGLATVTTDGTNITLTGRFISSLNGAASAPPGTFTGTWFTGGTATTTKPQVLIEPAGTTSASWSTGGTGLGINAASGFAGNLIDFQVNGTSRFRVANNGDIFGNTVSTSTAGLAPATSFSTITYGATVALDFASLDAQYRTINLTGNLELTTSNLANGRTLVLRIVADATQRTFTFPVDWKFVSTKPATLDASKTAILSLTAFGSTNADVIAAYAFQP
jgi:hypothetical protein